MINRSYFFTFEFAPNAKGHTTHQFCMTRKSWLPNFPSVWDSAIEHARGYNDVSKVLCTKVKRID